MRYLGGKNRIAKPLSEYINSRLKDNQEYWEPFVGAGWVISQIDPNRKRYASDIHPELIAMWKMLQQGWIPPNLITKEQYYKIKDDGKDYLKGFVGFGCSYGGKWWGGYANDDNGRNYTLNAKNSLLKKIIYLKDVNFFCSDYRKPSPEGKLIYCDPPYEGTTQYKYKFNHKEFWEWVRQISQYNTVLVSEYQSPSDFTCVWQVETKTDLRNKNNNQIPRTERLFEYKV